MPKPQISMPNSVSNKPGFYDDSTANDATITPHSSDATKSGISLGQTSKSAGGNKNIAKNNKNKNIPQG